MRKVILKRAIVVLTLLVFDFLTISFCFILSYYLRMKILSPLLGNLPPMSISVYAKYWPLLLIWPLVFAYEGLYTRRIASGEEMLRIVRGTLIATGIVIVFLFALKAYIVSRMVIGLSLITSFLFFPITRSSIKGILVMLRLWDRRILMIGGEKVARLVIRNLNRQKALGYRVVGLLLENRSSEHKKIEGVPILGNINEIEKWVSKTSADGVMIVAHELPREKLAEIMKVAEDAVGDVFVFPDFLGLRSQGLDVMNLDSMVLLRFRNNLLRPINNVIKRVFDLVVGTTLFLLTAPFFPLIAIIIKIDSKGPAFFVHKRVGKDLKEFNCIKFRTMHMDADAKLEELLKRDKVAREEWKKYRKIKSSKDPRITRVGKWLRKWSLDELPQLINVIKGEMSLVGPRPYTKEEIEETCSLKQITSSKPGLTGLYQISGRAELSIEDRLTLDEYYIRNWSLWLDIVILLRTIGAVLRREGAY